MKWSAYTDSHDCRVNTLTSSGGSGSWNFSDRLFQ